MQRQAAYGTNAKSQNNSTKFGSAPRMDVKDEENPSVTFELETVHDDDSSKVYAQNYMVNNSSSEINIHSNGTVKSDSLFHCHDDSFQLPSVKDSGNRRARFALWISVGMCLFFMFCEVVGGIWAQSLAIITDAAHLLTDLASMLISLFSLYLATLPPSQRMSFGWHRAEVLGAFMSVFLIWIVTGILFYLAIQRIIIGGYAIDATVMTVTASIGVCVNLLMGIMLFLGGHSHSHSHGLGHDRHDHNHSHAERSGVYEALPSAESTEECSSGIENVLLLPMDDHQNKFGSLYESKGQRQSTNINVRAAFVHVLGDLIQSIGVLIAGLLILWNPNLVVVDPICTLIFSLIVLSTTVYIIRDAIVVLLEGRPSNVNFRHVFDALENIEGVRKVHDLRIWALTVQKIAISVHLEVDPSADNQKVLRKTTLMLRTDFNAHETTIQIEGYQPASQNCFQCVVPQS